MNFVEAVKALSEGEYIREHGWRDDYYVYLYAAGLYNSSNDPFRFDEHCFGCEWELFDKRYIDDGEFSYSVNSFLDNAIPLENINQRTSQYNDRYIDGVRNGFRDLIMYVYKQDSNKAVEFLDELDNNNNNKGTKCTT